MNRIILAALVGVLVSGPAWGGEGRRLTEAEIIAFTQGGPFQGTTYTGGNFNVGFNKDGTIYGTSGSASDSGTWEVVKDTVCLKWDHWRSATRYCVYYVLMDDGSFQSFYLNGDRSSFFIGKVDLPKLTSTPTPKPSPTAIPPTVKTPQPQGDGSIEERLAKLKGLLDKGLLTPDEASAKRKEILKGL